MFHQKYDLWLYFVFFSWFFISFAARIFHLISWQIERIKRVFTIWLSLFIGEPRAFVSNYSNDIMHTMAMTIKTTSKKYALLETHLKSINAHRRYFKDLKKKPYRFNGTNLMQRNLKITNHFPRILCEIEWIHVLSCILIGTLKYTAHCTACNRLPLNTSPSIAFKTNYANSGFDN